MDLRELVQKIDSAGRLHRVARPVSTQFELANVAHAVDGRPVLFEQIQGHPDWRVLVGICSQREWIALALDVAADQLLPRLAHAIAHPQTPPIQPGGACHQVERMPGALTDLPILHHLPQDAGAYVTSAVVIVQDEQDGRNMAYHRLLRLDPHRFAARLVEGRGTHSAWQRSQGDLECAICIGVPLQVNLAAAIAPPPGVDELGIAHALSPIVLTPCRTVDLEVPADAELVLEGRITKRLVKEGPFPDLTETMDGVREQPVIEIDAITHRRRPIYHGLLPGGLEHKLLMGMPREPTIYAEVNRVARCRDVLITPGGASWLHAVVQIEKQSAEDGKRAIEAAFRGHGSLKHVVAVDSDVNIHDPAEVEWAIATRFQGDRDLVVLPDQPGSSLDPSGIHRPGKKARTTKMGLDATIPWGVDSAGFRKVRYRPVDLSDYLDDAG